MTTSPAPADLPPTFVVELTPPGRAAVAVVLAAGPRAVRAVGECFAANSGRPIADVPVNRIVVGRGGGPAGEELVVCRRGEDEVEVHCHGGIAAVRAVIEALVAEGCLQITWQEWLRQARGRVSPKLGFASRRDATTWAAQIALADAVTLRTAAILVDQLNGALSTAIRAIPAAIEAAEWRQAAELADAVWEQHELGMHLTSPWRVVIAGPPNVGKSSLINALAGYERAIVSPEPGTTRDVVTLTTAIDGWPMQLADTAGLRPSCDEIESAGVALAEAALARADLAVMVADATQPKLDDISILHSLPKRVLHVRNKIDLVQTSKGGQAHFAPRPSQRWRPAQNEPVPGGVETASMNTSALTGDGIAELAAAIGNALVPNPPAPGAAVPFTVEQVESLAVARNAIQRQHAAAASEALQAVLS